MSIIKRSDVLFPSLMNEIFKPDWFGGLENDKSNVPAVNIKETEKDFELELAVPGRKKEDFKIEINENVLTISTESNTEENIEKITTLEGSLPILPLSVHLPYQRQLMRIT